MSASLEEGEKEKNESGGSGRSLRWNKSKKGKFGRRLLTLCILLTQYCVIGDLNRLLTAFASDIINKFFNIFKKFRSELFGISRKKCFLGAIGIENMYEYRHIFVSVRSFKDIK